MKARTLGWLIVFVGIVLALSATSVGGWVAGVIVAGALALAVPLSVQRFRQGQNLVRTVWRAIAAR